MMSWLVTEEKLGRLSGVGWAAGYVGGLVSLALMAGLIVAEPSSGKTLLELDPLLQLNAATRQSDCQAVLSPLVCRFCHPTLSVTP